MAGWTGEADDFAFLATSIELRGASVVRDDDGTRWAISERAPEPRKRLRSPIKLAQRKSRVRERERSDALDGF